MKIRDESESSSDGEFTEKLAACVDGFKDQLIKLLVVKKKHSRKQQHPMQLIKSSFRQASLFDQESEIPVIPETSFLITDEERDALLQLAANNNAENVDQLDLQKKGNPELSEDDEPLVKRTKVDGKFGEF